MGWLGEVQRQSGSWAGDWGKPSLMQRDPRFIFTSLPLPLPLIRLPPHTRARVQAGTQAGRHRETTGGRGKGEERDRENEWKGGRVRLVGERYIGQGPFPFPCPSRTSTLCEVRDISQLIPHYPIPTS